MSVVSCGSIRANGRVRSMVSTGVAVNSVHRVSVVAVGGDDDVGDGAVDHDSSGSKTTVPIDAPSASCSIASVSGSSAASSASSASVVPSSGVGTSALPSSSRTTAASASSPPAPPNSSGTTSAAAPTCSHNSFHSDSS